MPLRAIRMLVFGTVLLSPFGLASANGRADFVAAESAYASGNTATYRSLKKRLAGYPLYQYLEYREVRSRLGTASAATVERFLVR